VPPTCARACRPGLPASRSASRVDAPPSLRVPRPVATVPHTPRTPSATYRRGCTARSASPGTWRSGRRVRLRGDRPDAALVAAPGRGLRKPASAPRHAHRLRIGRSRACLRLVWPSLPVARTTNAPRSIGRSVPPGSRRRHRSTVAPSTTGTVLVRLRRPVRHALGHRVRLVPDDVAAEVPAVGAEGERDHPRHTEQVLGFAPVQRQPVAVALPASSRSASLARRARFAARARVCVVRVPEVQPDGPVVAQHPTDLPEHFDQGGHELVGVGSSPICPSWP
jgi:hypothetical protein